MSAEKFQRSFSWWDKQDWKPAPPAAGEAHRPGHSADEALPQGEEKWRLNNPKKRGTTKRGTNR